MARRDDQALLPRSVVDKYPESPNVNLARHGLGMAYYQKGDLDKAQGAP